MLRAEASRVALALSSTAIFSSEESAPGDSVNIAHGFEATMELYERAIEGAKLHGFKQYEALGMFSLSDVLSFYLFFFPP